MVAHTIIVGFIHKDTYVISASIFLVIYCRVLWLDVAIYCLALCGGLRCVGDVRAFCGCMCSSVARYGSLWSSYICGCISLHVSTCGAMHDNRVDYNSTLSNYLAYLYQLIHLEL